MEQPETPPATPRRPRRRHRRGRGGRRGNDNAANGVPTIEGPANDTPADDSEPAPPRVASPALSINDSIYGPPPSYTSSAPPEYRFNESPTPSLRSHFSDDLPADGDLPALDDLPPADDPRNGDARAVRADAVGLRFFGFFFCYLMMLLTVLALIGSVLVITKGRVESWNYTDITSHHSLSHNGQQVYLIGEDEAIFNLMSLKDVHTDWTALKDDFLHIAKLANDVGQLTRKPVWGSRLFKSRLTDVMNSTYPEFQRVISHSLRSQREPASSCLSPPTCKIKLPAEDLKTQKELRIAFIKLATEVNDLMYQTSGLMSTMVYEIFKYENGIRAPRPAFKLFRTAVTLPPPISTQDIKALKEDVVHYNEQQYHKMRDRNGKLYESLDFLRALRLGDTGRLLPKEVVVGAVPWSLANERIYIGGKSKL